MPRYLRWPGAPFDVPLGLRPDDEAGRALGRNHQLARDLRGEGLVREYRLLHSYNPGIESLTNHLRAMAEGLDNPYFSDIVNEHGESEYYVVGSRPGTEAELAWLDEEEHAEEREDRAQLADLLEKYPDAAPVTAAEQ